MNIVLLKITLKRNLKELFEVEEGNDRNLLLKAEERGFI